jgi:tRNA1(Val) A37 N6-methylase TrmN6
LNRYALDTLVRIKTFSSVAKNAKVTILNEDARFAKFPRFDLVVTSPPYVGLIDYHEQHRYAYELLGLPFKREHEIGAAFKGSSKQARRNYCEEIRQVLMNLKHHLSKDGRFVIVVNDKDKLYDYLVAQCNFTVEQSLTRHVNRRTGRRAGDFFEEVLVWRPQ